jgi:hypothetical protein
MPSVGRSAFCPEGESVVTEPSVPFVARSRTVIREQQVPLVPSLSRTHAMSAAPLGATAICASCVL